MRKLLAAVFSNRQLRLLTILEYPSEVRAQHQLQAPWRAGSDSTFVQDARDSPKSADGREVRLWISINWMIENN
jgi:hypothetical protein